MKHNRLGMKLWRGKVGLMTSSSSQQGLFNSFENVEKIIFQTYQAMAEQSEKQLDNPMFSLDELKRSTGQRSPLFATSHVTPQTYGRKCC